jgi:hypothetical protein
MRSTEIHIDVSGGGRVEDSSLRRWIRAVPGLRVEAPSPPVRAGTLVVHLASAQALLSLMQALAAWLSARGSDVTLRISYADSRSVEVQGGTTADEIARCIEPALAPLDLEPEAPRPQKPRTRRESAAKKPGPVSGKTIDVPLSGFVGSPG